VRGTHMMRRAVFACIAALRAPCGAAPVSEPAVR
jgi:hypothetical protein